LLILPLVFWLGVFHAPQHIKIICTYPKTLYIYIILITKKFAIMKTKHTQGKWVLADLSYTGVNTTVLNEKEEVICDTWFNDDGLTILSGEPEANAKLIAAAPELLKACNFALQGIEKGQIDNITIKVLEDVIKKATE
jgi:hypothetical protein